MNNEILRTVEKICKLGTYGKMANQKEKLRTLHIVQFHYINHGPKYKYYIKSLLCFAYDEKEIYDFINNNLKDYLVARNYKQIYDRDACPLIEIRKLDYTSQAWIVSITPL